MIISLLAANHDPGVFPDPGTLDPARRSGRMSPSDTGRTSVSGRAWPGPSWPSSTRRCSAGFPGYGWRPAGQASVKNDTFVYGLHELPVTW